MEPRTRRGRPRLHLPAAVVAALVAVAATTLLVPGPATAGPVRAAASTAWVRAAHLVPGVGTMTIRLVPFSGSALSGVPAGSIPEAMAEGATRVLEPAVGYGGIGEYRQVPAGVYAVTIRPVGSGTGGPPVLTGTFEARAGVAVTLAALGGTRKDPRVAAITDVPVTPAAGTARVRLLPALPDASGTTIRAENGPVIAEDAPYGTPTEYRTVPAGTWTLRVTTTGTTTDSAPARASVDVASGGTYTVFVLGDGNGGIALKPVSDAQGMATAPTAGVQTGLGGAAVRPTTPAVAGGLGVAGAGAVALLVLAARPRLRAVTVRGAR
ncbi:MAG: DUF4397 domain-containing protein [Micrococcales bacterium]|nr:DUF4397 domain-containing protein [Micrococcales bacterium]